MILEVPPGAYVQPPGSEEDDLSKFIKSRDPPVSDSLQYLWFIQCLRLQVSTTLGMILRLMHEAGKGSASTFAPYLEVVANHSFLITFLNSLCPQTMHEGLPDTPIFWSSQELTELDGTAVANSC